MPDIVVRGLLNVADGAAHFRGGTHGFFRQLAHFVGHHGKPASRVPGPRRLNGGVQSQKIGLVGNVRDGSHNPADALGLFAERFHGLFEHRGLVTGFFDAVHGVTHHARAFTGTAAHPVAERSGFRSVARHL